MGQPQEGGMMPGMEGMEGGMMPGMEGMEGGMMPGMEGEMGGAYATEEQMQELRGLLEKVRGKIGEANAVGFSMHNMSEEERSHAVHYIFEVLQRAGVDLSDPSSVHGFIQSLRESNPDIAQLFEEFLGALLGEETGGMEEAGMMQGMEGSPMPGESMMPGGMEEGMMPQGQSPMMPQGQSPMMPQGQSPMMPQGAPGGMPQYENISQGIRKSIQGQE
jgi:hypothetical protein